MTSLIASSEIVAVVGMGQTGLSVARYLRSRQQKFMMLDTRPSPPNLETFQKEFPDVVCELGPLNAETLKSVSKIVLSPGVDIKEPAIQQAIAGNVPVVGDIQIFVSEVSSPIIAITGSNGKSTVTALVGAMLQQAGKNAAIAGNIGVPVLDLLRQNNEFDYFVLELSSFQLETVDRLNAEVAVILNISEDHMDRYASLKDYYQAKQRIFFGAKSIVVNRADPLTQPPVRQGLVVVSFGLDKPDLNQFGVIATHDDRFLAQGLTKLMPISTLKIRGSHNTANALAALAIGKLLQLSFDDMVQTLQTFRGLPHRCEWIRTLDRVDYINDSKGTNVGATLAAIKGLADASHKIILIAGGEGKGADFSSLAPAFSQCLRALIAIGRDAEQLLTIAKRAGIEWLQALTLKEAVSEARRRAQSGDIVLLSPACASFDMFKNYIDRGEQFVAAVEALAA